MKPGERMLRVVHSAWIRWQAIVESEMNEGLELHLNLTGRGNTSYIEIRSNASPSGPKSTQARH